MTTATISTASDEGRQAKFKLGEAVMFRDTISMGDGIWNVVGSLAIGDDPSFILYELNSCEGGAMVMAQPGQIVKVEATPGFYPPESNRPRKLVERCVCGSEQFAEQVTRRLIYFKGDVYPEVERVQTYTCAACGTAFPMDVHLDPMEKPE
jgi:hypothetical protein